MSELARRLPYRAEVRVFVAVTLAAWVPLSFIMVALSEPFAGVRPINDLAFLLCVVGLAALSVLLGAWLVLRRYGAELPGWSIAVSPHLVLWSSIIAIVAVQAFFLLNHQGMWSVDGGAYLLSRDAVLGYGRVQDFVRPPLAPGWLLVPFTELLGDSAGIKAFSLAASIAIIPAFWLFASVILTLHERVFATVLLMLDWRLTEMYVAGALPLLGFSLILVALWALWRLGQAPRRRYMVALALVIPAIAYVNQTSAGIAAIVLTAFYLSVLARSQDRARFLRATVPPVLAGVGLAATALPYYLGVAPGSGMLRYPGPLLAVSTFQNAVWLQWFAAMPLGVLALRRGQAAIGVVLITLSMLGILVSSDESISNILYRSRYLQSAFLYITAVWAVSRYLLRVPGVRRYALTFVGIMTACLALGMVYQLHVETRLGRMVTPETAQAIEYLNDQGLEGAVGTNSYSLSLYVAAMTGHHSPWTQIYDPPPAYRAQHAHMVCVLGWVECDVRRSIQALNLQYVLVDRTWPSQNEEIERRIAGLGGVYRFVNSLPPWRDEALGLIWQAPEEPWRVTSRAPWLHQVYERGNTIVWEAQ